MTYLKTPESLGITNASQLEEYICEWTINATAVDYVPVCDYGFVPKGWGSDGEAGNLDVSDINDCSLSVVDAFPSYGTSTIIYCFLTFLILCWSIRNAMTYRAKRLEAGGKNKNTISSSELMSRCMVFSAFCNFFTNIDIEGYHTFPYMMTYSIQYAELASLVSLLVILVRSWVTVLEGGKAKITPPWVNYVGGASLFCFWTFEVGGGIAEWAVAGGHGGAYNGNINAIRGFAFSLNCLMWVVICMRSYLKISKMLAKGGAGGAAKSIHKLSKSVMISCMLAFAYKGFFGYLRLGLNTSYTSPPCADSYFRLNPVIFMIVMCLMLASQHPSKPQKSSGASTVAPSSTE